MSALRALLMEGSLGPGLTWQAVYRGRWGEVSDLWSRRGKCPQHPCILWSLLFPSQTYIPLCTPSPSRSQEDGLGTPAGQGKASLTRGRTWVSFQLWSPPENALCPFSSRPSAELPFSWPLPAPGLPLSSNCLMSSLWPSGGQPNISLGAWEGNPSLGERTASHCWLLPTSLHSLLDLCPRKNNRRKLIWMLRLITFIVLRAHNLFTECLLYSRPCATLLTCSSNPQANPEVKGG